MLGSTFSQWRLRIITLLLAALASASVAFWVLQWQAGKPTPPAATVVFGDTTVPLEPQALARWLGAADAVALDAPTSTPTPTPSAQASAFQLLGVVAQADSHTGWALIAREGQAPAHFRVGSFVYETWRLQSVSARSAVLVNTAAPEVRVNLELPPLPGVGGL